MRQPLRGADQQTVVSGCARIFVCAYGIEALIWSLTEIEEAWMPGVRLDDREVGVAFAEQPVSKHADITNVQHEAPAELSSYRRVEMANFRVAQIVGDRTHSTKEARRPQRRQEAVRRPVREEGKNRWLPERGREQVHTVEVQRIEGDVEVCKLSHFGK